MNDDDFFSNPKALLRTLNCAASVSPLVDLVQQHHARSAILEQIIELAMTIGAAGAFRAVALEEHRLDSPLGPTTNVRYRDLLGTITHWR